MKFKINYTFDGEGETIVEAKNEEEAKDKFFNGDYAEEKEREEGTNYEIEKINKQ